MPPKIGAHRLPHKPPPRRLVTPKKLNGIPDGIHKLPRAIFTEYKAVTTASPIGDNGIGKTAHRAHHGDSTVTAGRHLGNSARLPP